MSIQYKFTVVSVDQAARCMEIVYEAEGHQTMHIGARLPYAGESVEMIVRMYEPVQFWLSQLAEVIVPEVGASGVLAPIPTPALAEDTEVEEDFDTFPRIEVSEP